MSEQCEALTAGGTYSNPGRCLITHNIRAVYIGFGAQRRVVMLCARHRKMVEAHRRLETA